MLAFISSPPSSFSRLKRILSYRMRVILGMAAVMSYATLIQSAFAETIEDQQHAAAEMVDSLSDCAAYFTFVKACSQRESGEIARKSADGASQAFDITSKDIYLFGQMANMSQSALLASLQLALDKVKEETNNGCQNLAVIIVSRAKQCKTLVERPQDAFFQRLAK